MLCTSSSGGWCVCAACRRWTGCSTSWPGRASSTLVCWQWNSLCSLKDTALWVSSTSLDHDTTVHISCKRFLAFICLRLTSHIFIIFAEECYHHRCRGFRSGCCTAAKKLWHSGNSPQVQAQATSCHTSSLNCCFTLFADHSAVPLHSFLLVYRWWCLRPGRELEVECGMILLWASL